MNATERLHDLEQSLWLQIITHALPMSGTPKRYIGSCGHGPDFQSRNLRPRHQGRLLLAKVAAVRGDCEALAASLQRDGTASFTKSWKELMVRVALKSLLP
jgi:hypothetical protein